MRPTEDKLKCLVLGANGFVGVNLCKGLLDEGYSVRSFSKKSFNSGLILDKSELEEVVGDFRDVTDIKMALAGVDVVFHLISTTLPQSSNDDPVYDVVSNVGGTVALLEAMREAGVSKMVFVSSGGTVYGVTGSELINEAMPKNPICSYGIGKVAIENYLFMYRELYGFEYFIFRLSNPYGVGRKGGKPQGAINSFLANTLLGKDIEIWGNGSVVRDYIYINDVVDACLMTLGVEEWSGEILNIGSGHGASLLDIISTIEQVTGISVVCNFHPPRFFDVPTNVLDIRKATDVLNWEPKTSLFDGIGLTKEWLSNGELLSDKGNSFLDKPQ